MTAPTRFAARNGFTLVELLVALVIAVLVAVVIVGLYGVATRTIYDQQQRARGPHAASTALDQLQNDLGRAFLLASDTNELFTLTDSGTGSATKAATQLSFLTFDPLEDGEPDWALCRSVQYRLEAGGTSAAAALVRIHRPLTGPGSLEPPFTNILSREVETFSVEVFDGTAWRSEWTPNPSDARRPQLVRVELGSSKWPAQRAEFLIPASLSLTTSLIRTSSASE